MSLTETLILSLAGFALLTLLPAVLGARRVDSDSFFTMHQRLGALRLGLMQAASGLSFWLLIGVSAAAYTTGLAALWLAAGILLGAGTSAWSGPRLRDLMSTPATRSTVGLLSIPVATDARGGRPARDAESEGRPRSAAFILALTFLVSMGVQFQIAGASVAAGLGLPAMAGIALVAVLTLLPALLSGRAGIANASLTVAALVAITAVVLPAIAFAFLGDIGNLFQALAMRNPALASPLAGHVGGTAALFTLGSLGMGLGLIGQAQVHDHVVAARSARSIRWGSLVTLGWYAIVLAGMLCLGWSARLLYSGMGNGEGLMLEATLRLLPAQAMVLPVLAIVAAASATGASQLLTLAEIGLVFRRKAPDEQIAIGTVRTLIVVATGIAAVTAFLISGSSRLFLFTWLLSAVACGPALLLRIQGYRIRPLVGALALRLGLALTLVLFLLQRQNTQWLVTFVPFLATYLVARSGRVSPQRSFP
jgi:Na+/proline symporter